MDAIQKSYDELLAKLSRLRPARTRTYWQADDFDDLSAHLKALAAAVDEHILDCGREARQHVRETSLGLDEFTGVLSGGLEGNALFSVEEAAESMRERARSDRAEHSTLNRAMTGV